MKERRYELVDSTLEQYRQRVTHDLDRHQYKPRPALRWLFYPEEYAGLAVWSLSVTCGSVWALITAMVTLMAMNDTGRALTAFFEVIYPGYKLPESPVAFDALINLGLGAVYAFAYGCLFGFLLGWLYRLFNRPLLYGVRFTGRVSESKLVRLTRVGKDAAKAENENAYTVLIVANPFIQSSPKLIPEATARLRVDPIMKERELFQLKVATILASLAQDETVAPFFDNIRFVTLFDPEMTDIYAASEALKLAAMKARALCLESHIDFLIEPAQRIYSEHNQIEEERLLDYLRLYPELGRVDVVFAITASETHTRSSSRFLIERKPEHLGANFSQSSGTDVVPLPGYETASPEIPGMVAYSAWDLRLETPAHEFAHAISSTVSGLLSNRYYEVDMQRSKSSSHQNGNRK